MGNLVFQATLGGQVNLVGPNTASTFNINVPAVAGTLVTTGDTGTVTNTMLAGSIANAKLTNSSVTLGSTSVSLGSTATTLSGLTLSGAALGTPTSGTLTNCTGLPASTGLTGSISEANGGTGTTTGYYGFKNRIINGAMVIDQRNAGASVTPTDGQYTLDRFIAFRSQASKYSVQQNAGSVTSPVGFTNYLGVTSLSAYSVNSTDYFMLAQRIEGYNVADLAWGTANAKTVTLSFQVYSSLTGTFGGSLMNGAQNRNYPFTYTISSANTWTPISITIAGDTTGTWATNNTEGIGVYFGLGMGSTVSGTAGAWASGYKYSATGATSVVGTNGATFYITGVQLEKGSTATSFDYRPYGTELALCQRYYISLANQAGFFGAHCFSTNRVISSAFYPSTMRATPTVTAATNAYTYFINGAANTSSASVTTADAYGNLKIDVTANATSGSNGVVSLNSTVAISAEL